MRAHDLSGFVARDLSGSYWTRRWPEMKRTELLQEVRKIRFEEAFGGWQERRLLQEEAARLLRGMRAHVPSPR